MIPKNTEEIAKAIKDLELKTLKLTIKVFDKKSSEEDKDELLKTYQETVLKIGTQEFVKKLKGDELSQAAKALGLEKSADKDDVEKALDGTVDQLLAKASDDLLKGLCGILSLGTGTKSTMVKSVRDEVMLGGMEKFLKMLDVPLLKSHCSEFSLSATGTKGQLVEKLMMHIFNLKPPGDESSDKEEDKKKDDKKKDDKKKDDKKKDDKKKDDKKKETKSKRSKKEDKEEESESEKEEKSSKRSPSKSPKRGRSSSPKASKSKSTRSSSKSKSPTKAASKGREKFVAPPLSTIKKGGHDSYVSLYDNFNLPDLVGYCRKNGLKVSGQKKEIIRRIIKFIETGVVEESKPKKRKRSESVSKKSPKSAKTSEEKDVKDSKESKDKKEKDSKKKSKKEEEMED